MTDSPAQERICVHCGTPRPVDEPLCPSCGKPWVDERIGDAAGATAAAAAATNPDDADGASIEEDAPAAPLTADEDSEADAAAPAAAAATAAAAADVFDDTGEFTFDDWTMPPETPRSRARWLIPIILLIAVVVVWVLVFLDDDTTTATTVAQDPVTTIAPTTTVAPTTTAAPATTTSSTTTTTIDYPPPSAWGPVGDPIPTEELTLRQAAIGTLDFGESITFVAGRLTASVGEAEEATVEGLCPPAESYALQWGELLAIFDGFRSDAVFVSYRYEDIGSDKQLGLTTLSGLALGDTVADLKSIYSQFTVAFETIDGTDYFRLLDGAELLLWGPVSSTDDDGIVEGIYSPSPCDDV